MPEQLENNLEQGNQQSNDTISYTQHLFVESLEQDRLQQTNHQEIKAPCKGGGTATDNKRISGRPQGSTPGSTMQMERNPIKTYHSARGSGIGIYSKQPKYGSSKSR